MFILVLIFLIVLIHTYYSLILIKSILSHIFLHLCYFIHRILKLVLLIRIVKSLLLVSKLLLILLGITLLRLKRVLVLFVVILKLHCIIYLRFNKKNYKVS
mmetsp:Transcript_7311/g.652  ORF Transcript_7311/g.652 Transcript_7311/m.652 type:complete len:101 (+) Transcript_7311:710-1012(+)